MRTALVALLMAGCWTPASKQSSPPAAAPAPETPKPSEPVADAPPPTPDGPSAISSSITGMGDLGPTSGVPDDVTPLEPKIKIAGLDPVIVDRYGKEHVAGAVSSCYAQYTGLGGELALEVTIGGDGKVTHASATGSGAGVDFESCAEQGARAVAFPSAKTGKATQVTYRFKLADNQDMNGGFGFGRGGYGPGGQATGWGTIGTGRYGTIGSPRGGMRGRSSAVPTVSLGQPTTTNDSLDKAIIRRYIKRNIQKLAYCYEKELPANPKLAGDVTAKFTINADGRVTGSTASGLHADVEGCVAKVIGNIEFPKPKGGKSVDVTYRFTYRPSP